MSFIPVLEYLAGIFTFGFFKLIFNDIIDAIQITNPNGNVTELGLYIWLGLTIIYIIGGAIWLWSKYTEPRYQYGGRFF